MMLSDLIDVVSLSVASNKSLRQTLSTIRVLWKLERRGAKGRQNGYQFGGMEFECINPRDVAFLYAEIFVAEPYSFKSSTPTPYILDGGVNIGMSVAYFKTIFPN